MSDHNDTEGPPEGFKVKHPKARCWECPWYDRGKYADAVGPADAKLLMIGEAPGRQEAKQGKVFVGPSGKLLDKVLDHHGLDRTQIRLTNCVACSPPNIHSKGPSGPPKDAIRACEPRLRDELKHRETVVLLGATSFKAVMESTEGITKARQGPPRTHPGYPGTRFVPTFHPAACLRSSDNFPSLVRDLRKVVSDISINWEPPIFGVFDDEDSAIACLDKIGRRTGYITLDIETASEKDTDLTHPDSLLCVGIGYAPNKAVVIGEEALKSRAVLERLSRLLSNKEVICQNGKFDIQVLMRLGIIKYPMLWADTMLASYAKDERPGHHGLKGRAAEELGAPDYAAELKPYLGKGKKKSYANIPRALLYRYNAYDAALTYNLWQKDERELAEQNLRGLHDYLVAASNELIYVELDGVGIDQEYLEVVDDKYLTILEGLEEELKPWVDNPRSTPQVLAACKSLLLPVNDTTADTLTHLLDLDRTSEQKEFLTKILNHRKQAKLYGTYIKGTRKRLNNGRLYTTFKLHGTVTGRLSSANPNLQNIPRGPIIKKLFIPAPGNVFVQADYSQAEWRAIACLAEDKYLQGALGDPDRDIHGEVAAKFFGPKFTKEQRVMAKTFVFGVAYGRGPDAIAHAFGVSVHEAERYIREFFSLIPDVVRWRKDVHKTIFTGGQALQTPFGRKRRFWLITRENKHDIEKEALAFLPQSIASDLTLNSLIRARRAFGTSSTAPKVRLTVHDSILVECGEDNKRDVARELKSVMETTAADVFSDFVPFPSEVEIGPSWGDLEDDDTSLLAPA